MGTTHTKHPKPNEDLVANQPRRRSMRRSLRFSKGSSKDALSSTEKYIQSLSEDFDKGIIYNLKLEELKNIETELNNIIRDLDNLSAVGITSSKRFELENSTRYFRNKVKAAVDNHMDNAIQKLNDSFRIPETNDDEEESKISLPERNDLPVPPHTLIETDSARITVKLKEISIKLREILSLLNSLDEIDDVTRSSSFSIIEKCKRELYNLQTRNEKLISKKWKCYRKIDEIRSLLGENEISNPSKSTEVASELRKVQNDATKRGKEGEDNYESDARGIEADVEDNEDKIMKSTNKEVERNADDSGKLKEPKTTSNHSNDLDKMNESKIRSIKLTIRNLHSFISSLEKVDETTKRSTNEALKNCKKELKDLQLKNASLSKKRTRRLKDIEELEAILHEKYCEASDGECNCSSSLLDSETEKPLKLMKSVVYESDDQKHDDDEELQRRNATIKMSKSESENEAFTMTKELSENFDNTCKKISEILLRKSASYDDLEILTRRIGEINNQFDGILRKISSIREVRENTEEDPTIGLTNDQREETYKAQETFEWKDDSKCSNNSQYVNNEVSQVETLANVDIKEVELPVIEENYETTSRKTDTFRKSSPDVVNIDDQGDECAEILRRDSSTIRNRRQSIFHKKYHQTHSVDELENTNKIHTDYQRFSEQNLNKMTDNSSENLISMRNIDLSQIASQNRGGSTSDFHQEDSIASRNIDLSQMVFRDSDLSLSRADQHNSFSMVHATEEYSTEEGGITITFKKHTEITSSQIELENPVGKFEENTNEETKVNECLESSSSTITIAKRDGDVSEQVQESLDKVQDHRRFKLMELEEKFHILKERIMNFVGIKSDDLYNELDEELLSIMISLDGLGIDSDDPLYEEKEKIVKDVFKYSSMLETKNLDYEYLDSFEQEIQVVEKEIRQCLAKEKYENLGHIIGDVDDMLNEIENKIVDHLLVERRDKSIQRLDSIRDKLKYLTKSK